MVNLSGKQCLKEGFCIWHRTFTDTCLRNIAHFGKKAGARDQGRRVRAHGTAWGDAGQNKQAECSGDNKVLIEQKSNNVEAIWLICDD